MDTSETPRWESTEWLTDALRRGEVIGSDVRVGSVTSEVLTGGFMADTLALQLEYENAAGGEPASMVGKFPSSNPDSRTAGKEMNAYEREVNFYKFFANDLSMRVPRCYFAEIDPETADFSLLIEDCRPAACAEPDAPNILDLTRTSLSQLAMLQRDTWMDPKLGEYPWVLDFSDPTYFAQIRDWAMRGWAILKRDADERLPSDLQRVGDLLLEKLDRWSALMGRRACLSHCDYRFSNILYRPDGEAITVDWQTLHRGNPGTDVAYFLNQLPDSAEQRVAVADLREHYFRELESLGIHDYSREDAEEDYKVGVIYCTVMVMVTTFGIGGTHLTDSARELVLNGISRTIPQIEAHDALSILE